MTTDDIIAVVVYFSKHATKSEGGYIMPKKILVPVDIGKLTEALVDYGHSLAERLDVSVTFLHVLPFTSSWVGFEKWIPEDAIKDARAVSYTHLTLPTKRIV